MVLRQVLVAVSLVGLAFASAPAVAEHDSTDCEVDPAPGETIEIEGLYVNDRGDPAGTGLLTGGGTWVYEESNDVGGLQLAEGDPGAADQETCGHVGDTLIL